MGSPFAPNEVLQRRCPARSRKVWGHGTVSRSDGLCKIQGTIWRKLSAVRTLRSASFKRKNNTLWLYSQQLKTNFGRLNNYIRFYLWKRKIPPMQRSDGFCRVNRRQNESGVLRGGKSFRDNPRWGSVQNEHDHILWMVSNQSTKSVRFVTENIMFRKVRQDDFEKFMTVKHKKSYYLAQIEVYLTFLLKRCPFYAAASVTAWR